MILYFEYHQLNNTIRMGEFKAHIRTSTETSKGVIGKEWSPELDRERNVSVATMYFTS